VLRRVAALYDIHGNLPALEAVLGEIDGAGIDAIVVGGDAVGGPDGAETLERLRALDRVRWIRGNLERELVEPGADHSAAPPPEALEEARAGLTDEQIRFLHALQERDLLEIEHLGRVLFCHATPRNDWEIVTAATPVDRLREVLAGTDAAVVVAGHTHVQFERQVDGIRLVNAGSVGMPYEDGPGAYWALLGPRIELRRTEVAGAEQPLATREEATSYFEGLARG
jgi:putative phosphoesterase